MSAPSRKRNREAIEASTTAVTAQAVSRKGRAGAAHRSDGADTALLLRGASWVKERDSGAATLATLPEESPVLMDRLPTMLHPAPRRASNQPTEAHHPPTPSRSHSAQLTGLTRHMSLVSHPKPTLVAAAAAETVVLLPPVRPDVRYTIVLDLDETVVYGRKSSLQGRPHLLGFLAALAADSAFEVVVWTAGTRDYAKSIVRELHRLVGTNAAAAAASPPPSSSSSLSSFFAGGRAVAADAPPVATTDLVEHLVYRDPSWFDASDYTKDLTLLGRNLATVLIIENTPDCVRENPQNGIIVGDFEGAHKPIKPSSTGAQSATLSHTPVFDTQEAPAVSAAASSRRHKQEDRTLLRLTSILLRLSKTTTTVTVPQFLSTCPELTRQTITTRRRVVPPPVSPRRRGKLDAIDPKPTWVEESIPVFYLASSSPPSGQREAETKVVKANADRKA